MDLDTILYYMSLKAKIAAAAKNGNGPALDKIAAIDAKINYLIMQSGRRVAIAAAADF